MYGNQYNPFNNPYYGQQPINRPQPVEMSIPQQNIPTMALNRQNGLLGKSVDSIDVVKAIDIPLDGSISYFPIADGSAIVTKQLQQDGTSRIIVYKPMQNIPTMQLNRQNGLLGKSVDNIEVVKAIDIPLDGSISYFPIADGSAIVTKQLQQDGTSRIIVYKPMQNKDTPKYVTVEELNKQLREIDLDEVSDLKEELENLKKEIKELKSKFKTKGKE